MAKVARQKHTIAPSYEQNTAKLGEIHGTVNLGFKRPVHEGYMAGPFPGEGSRLCPNAGGGDWYVGARAGVAAPLCAGTYP